MLLAGATVTASAYASAIASANASANASASASANSPPEPLPRLIVQPYMGTWYQVAWFPNRFQRQCVSDTTASYRLLPEGEVEVINRCRRADGSQDDVTGAARPQDATLVDGVLSPAKLEVSFLPSWLRWLPIWGSYWVIQLADDGRYAVISEASRKYLWVLSRTPQLPNSDLDAIRSRLVTQGFDLAAWQLHPQPGSAADAAPEAGSVMKRPATPTPATSR